MYCFCAPFDVCTKQVSLCVTLSFLSLIQLPDDADNYLPAEESTVMVTANSPAVRRGDLELEARSIKSPVLETLEATARI